MTFLDYCQAFALIAGGLAGATTFLAVGMPILGKYPGKLKHSLNDLFTGDLRADMAQQAADLRQDAANQSLDHTRAIHELTEMVADNHNADQTALHKHETMPGLHLTPEAKP